ncbi:N-acetyltransferase [Mucilaginibacter sp. Bleaf8]|uniref:GNAT family N-acetyltransferase n=1 Tax=Mucilaginibacter sp. Bleaf8 TaxID=2834430 RepID=UPI001BD17B75|nr:GNAT family N-acetyltransferase [Mucilaginibacter sp. Bleaf8]MBS7563241.1 N-acetyltransferase [Mucilaginibacter sp. Bleaf8]
MKYENLELINNQPVHKFELFVDGYRAFIDYKQKGNKVYLIHTEVHVALKGKGVAEAIVEKTLNYLEANHLILVPLCSYVQLFLKRHPEWNRLLIEQPTTD